ASNQATIWRWREAYQHDFAVRMDWNFTDDFKKVNHNPVVSLNSNIGKSIGRGKFKAGETVQFTAKGTQDPDGDGLSFNWFVYGEITEFGNKLNLNNANTEEVNFTMPELKNGQELHIILEVKDSGEPSLYSYRRIILTH
ncbi:MAG: hypothetical protein ACXWV5_12380, partial [Flavitalea sp.]